MDSFIFKGLPTRVIFGRGKLSVLGEEVERLGLTRVAVLTTPQQRATGQEIAGQLGSGAVRRASGYRDHAHAARGDRRRAGLVP